MKFGDLFEKIRSEKCLTKEFFARELEVTPSVIKKISDGVMTPTKERVEQLIKVLDLDQSEHLNFVNTAFVSSLSNKNKELYDWTKLLARQEALKIGKKAVVDKHGLDKLNADLQDKNVLEAISIISEQKDEKKAKLIDALKKLSRTSDDKIDNILGLL